MNSTISAKLQSFRKQIRRQQLNELFASKRRMLLNPMDVEQFYFRDTFKMIMENNDVENNVNILNNLSFEKQLFQQFGDPIEAEQLYFDIVHFLANRITGHDLLTKQHTNQRKVCLNTMVNLLADTHCPNSALADLICQLLNSFYCSLGTWGVDDETIQVCYVISNLINNNTLGQEVDEPIITYLLNWIEDFLHVKEHPEMSESLYGGVLKLIMALQKRYKLTVLELPELYKARILNFIHVTIYNTWLEEQSHSGLSLKVANFVYNLLPVIIAAYNYQWCEKIVANIFKQLGSIKKKLTKIASKTLQRFFTFADMPFQSQNNFREAAAVRQKIRLHILKKYRSKIMVFLSWMQNDMKIQIFEIIQHLVACDREDAPFILGQFVQTGIEDWMIRNFEVNNQQMNLLFMQIVSLAMDLKMGECFERFLAQVEKRQQGKQQTQYL